jgi:hypothetical protein
MERLLDGKAPASAIAATITRAPGGGCPRSPGGCAPSARMRGSARSWLSPDRWLVRALPAGHGLFGPVRSCDAASGVLSRDPRQIRPLPRGRDRIPFASDRRTPRRRRLVKGHGPSLGQDAFHRRVLPPPVAPPAFAFSAWDHEEPATGLAARVLVAFATAIRLSTPLHSMCAGASRHPCHRARPAVFRPWTERRSSTSAIDTIREHHRDDRLTPTLVPATRSACAPRGLAKRWAAPEVLHARPRPHASRRGCQPRFHRPGAGRLSTTRAPRDTLSSEREDSSTPTRSARTPRVVRPLQRRLEVSSRMLRIRSECRRRSALPAGGDTLLRSHLAIPATR